MADKSKIQWTDATYNPWHGCKKVSPGCKFCYMYRDKDRYGQDPTTVLRSKTNFNFPLKLKKPSKIFTCSWSDFFIEEADEWRDEVWEIIRKTPQHTYQILTKRPERIIDHLPGDWGDGYNNVWLGVSAENQKYFEKRVPILAEVPAKIRFVSFEPLIGPLSFTDEISDPLEAIDWAIVGGESGNDTGKYRYRKAELEWFEDIIHTIYRISNTAVFIKQLGTHLAKELGLKDRHGGDINEWPEWLKVREFPKQ